VNSGAHRKTIIAGFIGLSFGVNPVALVEMVMAVAAVTTLVILTIRETAHKPLQ